MDNRPKRRCVTTKNLVPSAVHYVGYVEDEETPEMIMRKFEELERIQAAAVKRSTNESSQEPQPGPSTSNTGATSGQAPDPGKQVQQGAEPTNVNNNAGNTDSNNSAAETSGRAQEQDDGGLDEAVLLEVFKRTSMFNVRSAMQNNDVLLDGGAEAEGRDGLLGGSKFYDDDDYLTDSEAEQEEMRYLAGFWSDDDFADQTQQQRGRRRQGGAGRAPKAPREPREPRMRTGTGDVQSRHVRHQVVTQYNKDTNALIRRKVRAAQPTDMLIQVRLPAPLPLSWGRTVAAYEPTPEEPVSAPGSKGGQGGEDSVLFECGDIPAFPYSDLGKSYQAVLINSGWEVGSEEDTTAASTQRLAALPMPRLCPQGFIFVWAAKSQIHTITRVMYAWAYVYVENLTWVFMTPNNEIACGAAPYCHKSHCTLLIFRKDGEGRDIEMRHQRSPDVVFDCVQQADGREWVVPPEVYNTIEVMLPTGKGQFLELWGHRNVRRTGWDHLVEVKQAAGGGSSRRTNTDSANAIKGDEGRQGQGLPEAQLPTQAEVC